MPNHFKVQVFLLTAGFQNMDWTWDLSGHPPNTLSLILRATHGEKQNHRVDSKATCELPGGTTPGGSSHIYHYAAGNSQGIRKGLAESRKLLFVQRKTLPSLLQFYHIVRNTRKGKRIRASGNLAQGASYFPILPSTKQEPSD